MIGLICLGKQAVSAGYCFANESRAEEAHVKSTVEFAIPHTLEEAKTEIGSSFRLHHVNLTELGSRTDISRKRFRRMQLFLHFMKKVAERVLYTIILIL